MSLLGTMVANFTANVQGLQPCVREKNDEEIQEDFYKGIQAISNAAVEDARNIPLAKAKMSNELTQMGKGIIQKRKRNPDNSYNVERSLRGIRLREISDKQLEENAKEDDDPMLDVYDVDDMLTILFEHRTHHEPASEVPLDNDVYDVYDTLPINTCRDNKEFSETSHRDDENNMYPYKSNSNEISYTSYTSTVEQPLKKDEYVDDTTNPSSTHRTHRTHIAPSGTVSVDDFLAMGKARGYPEIPDLDLKGGMMGWNSFANSRRLRIPDVVARLGGVA